MTLTLRVLAIVIAATLAGMGSVPERDAGAHTFGFPVVRYNPLRLPWAAESSWMVGYGNPPDPYDPPDPNNSHYDWQIDFSGTVNRDTPNYGEPVKSIGGGAVTYFDEGAQGYGKWAYVTHAPGFWSVYAHLCSYGAPAGPIAQGTWLGNVGNTGNVRPPPSAPCQSVDGAHLHFEAGDSSGTVDATLSGVSISHLGLQEPLTAHKSDNAGAGYTNPRTRDDAFHARALMPDIGPASTRKGKFTTCDAAETHYLYTCSYYAFTVRGQDFVGPRQGLSTWHETFSLVQSPSGNVVKVKGLIQKAYQSRLIRGGARVSSYLGRPLGEEGVLNGSPFMNFENGTIIAGVWTTGAPPRWQVFVLAGDGSTLLTRTLTEPAGAGDCASVNGDPYVNVIDLHQVAAHYGYDGEASYDRLYDFWHGGGTAGYADGSITALDLNAVQVRLGTCAAEA